MESANSDQSVLRLVGVEESLKTLDWLATSLSSLVGTPELEVQCQCDDNDQSTGQHAGEDTWVVRGRVLRSENGATDDTTNASETNKSGRAKGSLPLTSDVVGLPS